jgi:hypothetical protein
MQTDQGDSPKRLAGMDPGDSGTQSGPGGSSPASLSPGLRAGASVARRRAGPMIIIIRVKFTLARSGLTRRRSVTRLTQAASVKTGRAPAGLRLPVAGPGPAVARSDSARDSDSAVQLVCRPAAGGPRAISRGSHSVTATERPGPVPDPVVCQCEVHGRSG